jgi:TrmH family RNA methyltransferase
MSNSPAIRLVLVNTTHPGNIGASARAIKNMGFEQLYLVSPSCFPHAEAFSRSSGATDILENAILVSSLQEAISDCHLIIGTSARERALPVPLLTPRESAECIFSSLNNGNKVAVVFGQERMGLTNDELSLCHFHLYIPCNPMFPSLNIASAVQIVAYETHLRMMSSKSVSKNTTALATSHQLEGFYQHLEKTLIDLEFLKTEYPGQMMKKLRRLFGRTQLKENELNILRGILSAVGMALGR